MLSKIRTESLFDGEGLTIILDAPKGNVLDSIMLESISAVLDEAGKNTRLKCIVFQGADDHFSYGASVDEHTREKAPEMLHRFHHLFYQLMDVSIPTVAMVSGQCLGGGVERAMMCDVLFADETALCGQPEIRLGVFAPPASLILPMKVGQQQAERVLLTGESLSAKDLQSLGLTMQVFPDRQALHAGVDSWIRETLLPKSASSLRYAVKAARWQFNQTLRKGLKELEALYLNDLMNTPDANEGIQAFLERRKPKWGTS